MSALLAVEGKCVTSAEGIIDDDVDRSIRNLTAIGREGMGGYRPAGARHHDS